MKMKENSWASIGKLDAEEETYTPCNQQEQQQVEKQEKLIEKQRRLGVVDKPQQQQQQTTTTTTANSTERQQTHSLRQQQHQDKRFKQQHRSQQQQHNDDNARQVSQPASEQQTTATKRRAKSQDLLRADESLRLVDDEEADLEALKILEDRLRERRLSEERQQHQRHQQQQQQQQQHVKQQSKSRLNTQHDEATNPPRPGKRDTNDVNLSFCGCGFLGIYHVGVASCFHEYAPQLSMHKISGSSAGALVAMAHICGNLQLAYCTTDILAVAIEARSHTLGPFHPSFDIQASVREALERGLPEDCYLSATGKLHVSLTRVEDGENVIISEFKSKEDLIQVLLCSCFIPFWSGIRLPKYRGVAYIDGGFSNNLLTLDDKTVTVSPFAGEADICPQDDTLNLLQINLSNTSFSLSPSNLYRLSHALLPPEPEVLSDLCKQGFADGIRYLQRMNLISCTKCLEIRSSLLVTTGGEDMEEIFSMSHTNETAADQLAAATTTTNGPQLLGNSAAPNGSGHFLAAPTNGQTSETSSLHHIILEQQEQRTIEISERRRRGSVVSTKSQVFPTGHSQQQVAGGQQTPVTQTTITLRDLLNGKTEVGTQATTHCSDCNLIRQKALYDPLPKQFRDRIRDSCDKVNKSLKNWIYSHRPVKYLSYLMVPYYLPIDLTLAVVYRFWKKLPTIREEISDQLVRLLDTLIVFLRRMQSRSTSAMLMGFGSSWEEDVLAYEKELLAIRQQQQKASGETTQVHHHHHHHHHHTHSSGSAAAAAAGNGPASLAASLAGSNLSLPTSSVAAAADSVSLPLVRQRASSNHSLASSSHFGSTTTTNNGGGQGRELHSLEDTFDSIVDVTSEQEGRIFAYYFRDSKDRLRVTEIFDLDHLHGEQAATAAAASQQQQQRPL